MKKVAFVVALGALSSLGSGCPSNNRTDAGPDAPMVVLPDAPSTRDVFRRPDAFVVVPAGACGAAIDDMDLFGPLPPGCLPRCNAATVNTLRACFMASTMMCQDMACQDCVDDALQADTSPRGRAFIGNDSMGMPVLIDISCGGAPEGSMENIWDCEGWQNFSCYSDSCPAELGAYLTCANANPGMIDTACASQLTTLRGCFTANQTELDSCAQTRAGACYDVGGAFVPSTTEARVRSLSTSSARVAAFAALRSSLSN